MIGLDFWGTMGAMITGGVLGFLIYYHFSKIVLVSTKRLTPLIVAIVPHHLRKHYSNYHHKRKLRRKNKKKFTKRNRRLVKLGRNYGMYTIIIFTPILISLVLGAFLLRKYYGDRSEAVPLMIASIIIEGSILIAGYWHIMGAF